MVLSKQEIRRLLSAPAALIESFISLDEQLQPNGFDFSVRDVAAFTSTGAMGAGKERTLSELTVIPFDNAGYADLKPGPYLVTFNEVVNLPRNLMAIGRTRSSLLRCGVSVPSAVWDAGYHGRSQSLFVVHNPMGFRLPRNARVLQLVFMKMNTAAESGYNGLFQKENL
jgi:dUTP pyrophosphatase